MDPNINARINCCFRLEPKSESKDARVHCVVLKVRAVPTPSDHHYGSVKQEKVQKVQSETLESVPFRSLRTQQRATHEPRRNDAFLPR
jgi:hypothetical protein